MKSNEINIKVYYCLKIKYFDDVPFEELLDFIC